MSDVQLNVFDEPLQGCSDDPLTGYYRDGFCSAGPEDIGRHTVCVVVTDAFLAFSRSRGNDLSTPMPQYRFPGLKAGDRWCLVAVRWAEALAAGMAPRVVLQATNRSALRVVSLEDLTAHAIDLS